MSQKPAKARDLLLTEAEAAPPPHDVTVPEPQRQHGHERQGDERQHGDDGKNEIDADVLREVHHLAERLGGLGKLKEVVDLLQQLPR